MVRHQKATTVVVIPARISLNLRGVDAYLVVGVYEFMEIDDAARAHIQRGGGIQHQGVTVAGHGVFIFLVSKVSSPQIAIDHRTTGGKL